MENKPKVILISHVDVGSALHAATIAAMTDKGIEIVKLDEVPNKGELSEVVKQEFEKTKREIIPLKIIEPERLYGFEPGDGKARRRDRRAKERKKKKWK